MAEQQKAQNQNKAAGYFRKQATDRLTSPDDLDQFLKVTSPSVWLVLLCVVLLLVGLLAWGVFGSASSTISKEAVRMGDATFCFVTDEELGQVKVGDVVYVNGENTTVSAVAEIPLSPQEVRDLVGSDYLVQCLVSDAWGYRVDFVDVPALATGVPLDATLTTERIAPISLIVGNGA